VKKQLVLVLAGLSAIMLLSGCLDLRLGGGSRSDTTNTDQHPVVGQQMVAPTIGQQLIDLQKAREAGAISDQEYQDLRTKLLQNK